MLNAKLFDWLNIFAKQSEYLPNYLRFPKEFVKLFGI